MMGVTKMRGVLLPHQEECQTEMPTEIRQRQRAKRERETKKEGETETKRNEAA